MSESEARTNGFLFADLRGYTQYVERHGDQAAAALLETYRGLVRDAVARSGGAEIKTEGDSFYVVFASVSGAVRCGLDIVGDARRLEGSGGLPVRVGIGVHAGETVETAEGYVGSAVNIAARVCSEAGPGEVLVTDTVRSLTRTFLPVRFVDRRVARLKGVSEPLALYRVVPSDPTSPAQADAATRAAAVRPRAIGLTLAAIAGAIVLGTLVFAMLPSAQPTPPPPATASTQPSASVPPFPDLEEQELVAQLPMGIRDRCTRSSAEERAPGASASVRCDLPLADDADTVWYDRFPSLQQLSTVLLAEVDRRRLLRGDCGPDTSFAQGNWQVGSTHTGRVLCYPLDGSHWITWSYDPERILARAVRRGAEPGDWPALFAWWEQIRLFLR